MKKIMTLSDIHVDALDPKQVATALKNAYIGGSADLLLIGGDVGNNVLTTIPLIDALNDEGILTYYVPGNHDLWNKANGLDTKMIYEMYRQHSFCLLNKQIEITDKTVIVGHIGWYDYSLAAPAFTEQEMRRRRKDGAVWQDGLYVDFSETDGKVCDDMNQEICNRMDMNQEKDIVLITHMINHENYMVRHNKKRDWTYFNGFLGSKGLMEQAKKAKYAICGHVHYRHVFTEGQTHYICRCLGYEKEWSLFGEYGSLEQQIQDTIYWFEVE